MRYSKGALDPSDSERSVWVGGPGGGLPERLACDGEPVIGVYGRSAVVLHAFGLVQADRGPRRRNSDGLRTAIRIQIQLLTEALAKEPNDSVHLSERAELYTWLGQYDHAAADYDRALALQPDQYLPATINALIRLLSGDRDTYLRLSEQAVRRFHDRTDRDTMVAVCRTYLLGPRAESGLFVVARMAGRTLVEATDELQFAPAFTWGLVKFRGPGFPDAEQWLRRASDMSAGGPEKTAADLFRAMALERSDRHERALRLFQQVRDVLRPSDPDALLRHYPRDLSDWLTAVAAFNEAQSTIPGAAAN